MSDHALKIDFERAVSWDRLRIVCSAPAEAMCRAEWDCDCEAWDNSGADVGGPWHERYTETEDGTITETHYGKPGGECAYALSINDSGCVDELGGGTATVPVDMEWDGDGWCWSFSEK